MVASLTHLDRKGNSIQKSNSLLVFSIFIIWISAAPNRNIIHLRNSDDRWRALRHIELFVLLLEIK